MLLNMSGLPNLPHPLPALSSFPPSPLSPLSPPFCSNSHPLIPSPLLSLTLPSDLSSPSRPAFPLTFLDSIVNNKKFLSPCLLPPHNAHHMFRTGYPSPVPTRCISTLYATAGATDGADAEPPAHEE